MVPSASGIRHTANQKVFGYSHNIHATIIPLGIFVRAIIIVAHRIHGRVKLMVTFPLACLYQCTFQSSPGKLLLAVDDNYHKDSQLVNIWRIRNSGVLDPKWNAHTTLLPTWLQDIQGKVVIARTCGCLQGNNV